MGLEAILYFQMRKKEEPKKEDEALKIMMEWMKEIKQGTENSKETTEKNIQELNRAGNERLDNAGRVIAQLSKELGSVGQIGPDIQRFGQTPKVRADFPHPSQFFTEPGAGSAGIIQSFIDRAI